MIPGWLFVVPCQFSRFFMIPGGFLCFSWLQVGFCGFQGSRLVFFWSQVGFGLVMMTMKRNRWCKHLDWRSRPRWPGTGENKQAATSQRVTTYFHIVLYFFHKKMQKKDAGKKALKIKQERTKKQQPLLRKSQPNTFSYSFILFS